MILFLTVDENKKPANQHEHWDCRFSYWKKYVVIFTSFSFGLKFFSYFFEI